MLIMCARDRRYMSEMKLVTKERSWLAKVADTLRGHKDHPSKHEQIFGFMGSSGPSLVLSCIKLVLLGSIVSIAGKFNPPEPFGDLQYTMSGIPGI